MLNKISENYLKEIDKYIEKNLNSITCEEIRAAINLF